MSRFVSDVWFFLVFWCFCHRDSSSLVVALDQEHSVGNPFHCTMSSNDKASCVLLKHCVWCQGDSLPGICVSEKQEKVLIHKIPYVKCFDNQVDTTKRLRVSESIEKSVPYDPICLTAPSDATPDESPEESCNSTTDSQGDMCVWCDAAGVFNLCLSHEQAQKASSYLQCDLVQVSSTL